MFLESENHITAVSILRKENHLFMIKFYDPNKTNIHIRCLFLDVRTISFLTINDLLNAKAIQAYFPASSCQSPIISFNFTSDREYGEYLHGMLYVSFIYQWDNHLKERLHHALFFLHKRSNIIDILIANTDKVLGDN